MKSLNQSLSRLEVPQVGTVIVHLTSKYKGKWHGCCFQAIKQFLPLDG
jgi:hypothetical protein